MTHLQPIVGVVQLQIVWLDQHFHLQQNGCGFQAVWLRGKTKGLQAQTAPWCTPCLCYIASPPHTHTHCAATISSGFRSKRMTDLHRFYTQESLSKPLKHCLSFIPRTVFRFTNSFTPAPTWKLASLISLLCVHYSPWNCARVQGCTMTATSCCIFSPYWWTWQPRPTRYISYFLSI